MNTNHLPNAIPAGTTVRFRREFPKYPPSEGWSYQLAIRAPGLAVKTATVDGTGFLMTLTPADTASIKAGTYAYAEMVTNGTDVFEVSRGMVAVTENLIAACSDDGRTHAQRALDAIEAALEGRLSDGIQNYSIGGRAVSKIPLPELFELRNKYRLLVYLERNKGRLPTVHVTFGGNY